MSKKVILAEPRPENLDPVRNWYRTLRIDRKSIGIVPFKVLLSKLLYTSETFTEEDEVQLFASYERCVEKLAEDSFHKKNFWLIWINRNIFNGLSNFVKDSNARIQHRESLDSYFSQGRSQLNAFVYYGATKKVAVSMKVGYPSRTKPVSRIGVGYRDKGNARNTAWDGSPPWQEVALDEWFQIHNTRESQISKVETLWSFFRVGDHFSWLHNKLKPYKGLGSLMYG